MLRFERVAYSIPSETSLLIHLIASLRGARRMIRF